MAYDSEEAGELELGLFLARKLAKCPRTCAEGKKKKKLSVRNQNHISVICIEYISTTRLDR